MIIYKEKNMNKNEDFVIRDTTLVEYKGTNKDVIIPDGITKIEQSAFWGCRSITSIEMPNSVADIGDAAFCHCGSLTSVTMGNNVKNIGDSAFQNCTSLINIKLPKSLTNIGKGAFCNCVSLTNIEIPDNVKSIGGLAFAWCKSLTIYCKEENKPEGWDCKWNIINGYFWNSLDDCPVVWGYKGGEQ